MSTVPLKRINEFGLNEVSSPPQPLVDVVFVHGLNGHPYNTWSTHDPDVFWPSDLLPQDVDQERCRILTYGYDANVSAFKDGATKDHIHYHAETLTARLAANRSRLRALERPLIFVVHSLGGLVVKRMLVHSNESTHLNQERLRSIFISTYAILFLGTPHNGSDLAKWGSTLQSICAAALPKKMFDTQSQLVKALETNNETLQLINRDFTTISTKFRIYFFHEAKPMDLKGTRQFIVDEDSAAPNLPGAERAGIEKDHSSMCKFEDAESPGYDLVSEAIQRYAAEAPITISGRWQAARRDQELQKQDDIREIFGDDVPAIVNPIAKSDFAQVSEDTSIENSIPLTKDPGQSSSQTTNTLLLVAPLGFRPNSIFKGFGVELEWLDRKLKSKSRLQLGTTAVLLWGPPGCGKSHLARQYVYAHRHEHPAGTFWLDCSSTDTLLRGYWNIGRRLGCLNDSHSGLLTTDSPTIHTVREALQERRGWILVFDGILCISEDEIKAFQQYLPDSEGNKIIYTSVNRTLARRHRLLVPSALKVPQLPKAAACELLFATLDINTRAATPIQQRKAAELVRYYKYLPLGIHAAAYALMARGRALERFVPGRSDGRLAQPFLDIFETLEEGNFTESLTLLTLLSFIYHRVPVALLHFGAKFLRDKGFGIESADSSGGIERHIDNTIAVLIQRGLVERQLQPLSDLSADQDDSSPEASRKCTNVTTPYTSGALLTGSTQVSQELSELEGMVDADEEASLTSIRSIPSGIDTLRLHSVVQHVVRDIIKGDQLEYHRWLILASQFLQASYSSAQRRESFHTVHITLTDYHEFRTHGKALLKHFPSTEKEVSRSLFDARHDLRDLLRTIEKEIRDRSPAPSFGSNQDYRSVFELSTSSSEHSPFTPSNLSRSTTWSLSRLGLKTESLTHHHQDSAQNVIDGVENRSSTTQEGSDEKLQGNIDTHFGAKISVSNEGDQAVLSASTLKRVLTGYHPGTRKDLGESRKMPVADPVEWRMIEPPSNTIWWPYRRESTSKSEAEESLAAALRSGSPSRALGLAVPLIQPSAHTPETGEDAVFIDPAEIVEPVASYKGPLSERSPNVSVSVSADELPTKSFLKNIQRPQVQQRTMSSSPRLRKAILANQAASSRSQQIPIERNVTITRRSDIMTPTINTVPADSNIMSSSLPSGYCSSIPMSRNTSMDSQLSVPVTPMHAFSAATSPAVENFEIFLEQSQILPSIASNLQPPIASPKFSATRRNLARGMENDLGQTIEVTAPHRPSLLSQSREQPLRGLGVSSDAVGGITQGDMHARV